MFLALHVHLYHIETTNIACIGGDSQTEPLPVTRSLACSALSQHYNPQHIHCLCEMRSLNTSISNLLSTAYCVHASLRVFILASARSPNLFISLVVVSTSVGIWTSRRLACSMT